MDVETQLNRQRVKHIVSSYQLDGHETEAFEQDLDLLLSHFPLPLIELALVETLVDGWLQVPLLRGCAFLAKVYERLNGWEEQFLLQQAAAQYYIATLSPAQFQQITGLDPTPIFGASSVLASQATTHSLGKGC